MEDTVLAKVISKSTLFVRDKFSKDPLTEQDIREAMASAVLLEAAKEEHLSGQGDTMCNQLMKNHDGMAKSLASTDAFRAFTEDASMDMLKHFIMTDGARNMLKAMKTIASNRAMQQEQEMKPDVPQKQDASKMIGMS